MHHARPNLERSGNAFQRRQFRETESVVEQDFLRRNPNQKRRKL